MKEGSFSFEMFSNILIKCMNESLLLSSVSLCFPSLVYGWHGGERSHISAMFFSKYLMSKSVILFSQVFLLKLSFILFNI